MQETDRQKLYKYIFPAVFTVVFTVVLIGCIVFAIKSGKTLPQKTESESKGASEYIPPDPSVTEKYGDLALFDGYFAYSERTNTVEITSIITEPDGSVIKHTEKKKISVPVLSVHEGCFMINRSGGSRILSHDGATLLRSNATVLPAGISFDGLPLFEISGRTVDSSGKEAVAAEPTARYHEEDGAVYGSDGRRIELPSGFSFAGEAYEYLILKSDSTGLCGLYSPTGGWTADPVYDAITSSGGTAFAAAVSRGVLLVAYSGEKIADAGVFTEITVSGAAACAYSETTGWVAFDLSEVG